MAAKSFDPFAAGMSLRNTQPASPAPDIIGALKRWNDNRPFKKKASKTKSASAPTSEPDSAYKQYVEQVRTNLTAPTSQAPASEADSAYKQYVEQARTNLTAPTSQAPAERQSPAFGLSDPRLLMEAPSPMGERRAPTGPTVESVTEYDQRAVQREPDPYRVQRGVAIRETGLTQQQGINAVSQGMARAKEDGTLVEGSWREGTGYNDTGLTSKVGNGGVGYYSAYASRSPEQQAQFVAQQKAKQEADAQAAQQKAIAGGNAELSADAGIATQPTPAQGVPAPAATPPVVADKPPVTQGSQEDIAKLALERSVARGAVPASQRKVDYAQIVQPNRNPASMLQGLGGTKNFGGYRVQWDNRGGGNPGVGVPSNVRALGEERKTFGLPPFRTPDNERQD